MSELITLSREELYEKVWQSPMSKLCKEFGLSDKGLAKICHRHKIPVPGSSFWRRKNLGQNPDKLALPEQENSFPIRLPRPKAEISKSEVPKITVPTELSNPHQLIKEAKKILSKIAKPNKRVYPGQLSNVLEICVSKGTIDRALRIFDTIIKEIESRGGSVVVNEGRGTHINLRGQSFGVHMQELTNKILKKSVPADKGYHLADDYEYPPTGKLFFSIDASMDRLTHTFQDRKTHNLEDKVGVIIRSLELFADHYNERAKEREIENRIWQERQTQKRIEKEKQERLKSEIANWEETRKIRIYLRSLIRKNKNQKNSAEQEWIDWISEYLLEKEKFRYEAKNDYYFY